MKRREFLAAVAAAGAFRQRAHAAAPVTISYRQEPPYAAAMRLARTGSDEFPGEKTAMALESSLSRAIEQGASPLSAACRGVSPVPQRYESPAADVQRAVFGDNPDVVGGWRAWRESLGHVRRARFYSLPGNVVRYDVRATRAGRLEHRIGLWNVQSDGERITELRPIEETLVSSTKPWFRDVTGHVFGDDTAFKEQLSRGVPYWRGRLDPACGIDLYGQNGVAVADVDGDGQDEIYVCQPGGLPNRLYKVDERGRAREISKECGLDILDDSAAALFLDLRNTGAQDLVLVRSSEPVLFVNDGHGRFTAVPGAFRFANRPQGSFTSVAAADFDRDGRVDLYFCCYVYYQSDAQYRYPTPYHDAQNGPPNFLFRNRLNDPSPHFEDVTAASGIDHNNNRFSFAANWCDYDGDGWPDLYVTNDFGRNNLYRNVGGRFHDVAEQAGVVDLGPGMSSAWFDYDGDGRPDLLVSNMWSACGQRIVNDPAFGPVKKTPSLQDVYRRHVKGNSLYRNKGDGTFEYVGAKQGIEICPWSWSCDGADLDNDGSPEIYVACGMVTNNSSADLMSYFYRQVVSKSPPDYRIAPEYENGWNAINQLIREEYSWAGRESNVFFARRGGRYHDFSGVSGIDLDEDSRAFAFADLDGDGNVDIVLKSRLGPQVRVFQNDCTAGRRAIVLRLRGTRSNRDAIGARVEIDGQVKFVTAGSGYLSQHTKSLHFGLGAKDRVARIRIDWPSGQEQELEGVPAGFAYEITEGVREPRRSALRARSDWRSVAVPSDNEARLHDTWLWEPVPLPDKRRGPALLFLHAGEPAPKLDKPLQSIDVRSADRDLVAAYAIFRRYLFDYRVDLSTPLSLLIDASGRLRKVYASTPDSGRVSADMASLGGILPDARGLPFEGQYLGQPRRDYYKFGGALLASGYGEYALPYLEEMLRRTPDNAKALFAVGRIHFQANRLEPARAALQAAVRANSSLTGAWNELGGVEAAAGDQKLALQYFQKALALQPDFIYALINAAQAYDRLGDGGEAERLYRAALKAEPHNGEAANGLGLLLAKQGQTDEAKRLFELAISVNRKDTSAINNLGVLFVNNGRLDDALAAFEYGVGVAPDDDTLSLNLARVWVSRGNRDKAADVLRHYLDRKPDDPVAQRALRALDTP